MELNQAQKQAVEHSGTPLMVLAGPGSGKTRVITERVIHMIKSGIKPEEILCLTFSEKAADEMKTRIEEKIDSGEVEVNTFHAFTKEILEDNVLDSGIGLSSGILKRSAQLVWGLKNIDSFGFEKIEIGNNAVEIIESIIDGISTFKNEVISAEQLDQYLEKKSKQDLDDDEKEFILKLKDLSKVYHQYEEFQRGKALVDFDDMIIQTIQLFRSKENVLKKYQKKFKHVLVDEFQDNNYAQLELVKLIANTGNVTVVGDDDQSIYRFQGAYLTNFQDFEEFYKDTTKIVLDQNYRSTKNIVKLGSELLDGLPNRQPKNLFTDNEQGDKISIATCEDEAGEVEFVVEKIKSLIGKSVKRRDDKEPVIDFKDIVILARRKQEGKKFSKALKAHGIPSTFVGESNIFSSPIIRDLMAFLNIANNPGQSGIEINRLMKSHGISEHNRAIINHNAKAQARKQNTNLDYVFESLKEKSFGLDQSQQIEELAQQIQNVIDLENSHTVSDIVYKIMMSNSDLYKRTISENTMQNKRDQLLLKEMFGIALDYESLNPQGTLSDFIDYLNLMGKLDIELREGSEFKNAVQVTTIHQSKGKEFPIVFIVDAATNRLPLKYQAKEFYVPNDLSQGVKVNDDEKELYLQEERRLFYVGITRAQNHLFITRAKIYGQNQRETKASKFLEELNYEDNEIIDAQKYTATAGQVILEEEDRLDKKRQEVQDLAIKSLNQMNLKTAIQNIINLAKIKYFEENKSLEGFKPQDVLQVAISDDSINAFLEERHIPLVDRDKLSLSASSVKTYKDCPLQFKFNKILGVPTKSKTYFDLGSSVHKVTELVTKKQIEGEAPTEKLALDILEKEWRSDAYETKTKETQDYGLAKNMLKSFLDWAENNPNKPIDVEKKFRIEIGGIPFNGFIDRVEMTPDGEYEVVDFKTGYNYENSKSIREDFQMNIYALGVEKIYGKLPKKASLFYIKKDKFVEYIIDREQVEMVKSVIEEKVNSILNEEFEPTPKYQTCKWCDFQPICDSKEIEE
jgi:DNA helicase-2/ATP-dependent DNA helicase PcrA